ncbi:MAG TPA: cupin domain-containing protein [Actinomycetota bacterium]|jgi:hypothetical protein|nr:cupin domain-containing protein [Actinomycetota bacterium]
MATVSKETAREVMAVEGYEGRSEDLGGYTVAYETFTSDQDPAPLFAGLPGDHCQCPHWGTVVSGELTYRYSDGTSDTAKAGESYYARPGHLPLFTAGTETIEFSPTDGLAETMSVIGKNLEAMAAHEH